MKKTMILLTILMVLPTFTYALEINSTVYCSDNYTLSKVWTVDSQPIPWNKYCQNGCDNLTMVCNPPVYQQNVIDMGIVIAVIAAIALIYKYGRR
jgi:hypothetical protein